MKERITDILFALIRFEIKGEKLPPDFSVSEEELSEVFKLAKRHEIGHLVIDAAKKNGIHTDSALIRDGEAVYCSLINVIQTEFDQKNIMSVFEKHKISYVILKGSVLRYLYPEKWMRTSGDIDILIHKEQLNEAIEALKTEINYTCPGGTKFHDIDLFSPSGRLLELHYSLFEEEEYIPKINNVLGRVWEFVTPLNGLSYGYKEMPEFFVCHHLAHMAYHMAGGGCGIRSFIDNWIISKQIRYDTDKLNALTESCGLTAFKSSVDALTEYWMEDGALSDLGRRLGEFVLNGGVFGTAENRISVQAGSAGGRVKYLFRRTFVPLDILSAQYPWIEKRKYLVPIAYLLRVSKLFRWGTIAHVNVEIGKLNSIDSDLQNENLALFRELELK